MNAHSSDLETLAEQAIPVRRRGLYGQRAKRTLDIILVLLILPAALPLMMVLSAVILLDGHSPIYRQMRIGKGGRRFSMLKLRTMVPDADQHLRSYLDTTPAARREWAKTQKLRDDPRITRYGVLLRKTSLDELPQLFNVLAGDMSLVGPRPMMVAQRDLYPGRAYFRLKPGITGLWQISERNSASFAQRAEFDHAYEQRLSFRTDIGVLFKTIGVVLRGTGY